MLMASDHTLMAFSANWMRGLPVLDGRPHGRDGDLIATNSKTQAVMQARGTAQSRNVVSQSCAEPGATGPEQAPMA